MKSEDRQGDQDKQHYPYQGMGAVGSDYDSAFDEKQQGCPQNIADEHAEQRETGAQPGFD